MDRGTIKLYGYVDPYGDDPLIELGIVNQCLNEAQARSFAKFLNECVEGMESDPLWEHVHFNPDGVGDIVVSKIK